MQQNAARTQEKIDLSLLIANTNLIVGKDRE